MYYLKLSCTTQRRFSQSSILLCYIQQGKLAMGVKMPYSRVHRLDIQSQRKMGFEQLFDNCWADYKVNKKQLSPWSVVAT